MSLATRWRSICAHALVGIVGIAAILGPILPASSVRAEDVQVLDELTRAAARISATDARQYNKIIVRLATARAAIKRCEVFFIHFARLPEVAAALKNARMKPGGLLFTTPQLIDEINAAAGRELDLSQLDLELCLQLRDQDVGPWAASPFPGLFAIDASLKRCLADLRNVGPKPVVLRRLQRITRGVRDDSFTSAAKLAALEQAAGQDLSVSARDLEICSDTFDAQRSLDKIVVGENSPPCDPNTQSLCVGTTGNPICCDNDDSVCSQTCGGRGQCLPWCESKCFPANATVQLEDGGIKLISEVRLGDRVRVARPDGSLGFEEVYLNTHKDRVGSARYVELALASGRRLSLSPRHFIPTAGSPAGGWGERVTKGADEIRPGDLVWSETAGGGMALDQVEAVANKAAIGAFNPLTRGGTIIVDGVAASAHSDWFLDGIVSAHAQAATYQAILAPVRVAYDLLGPSIMERITEEWGVVDAIRNATTVGGRTLAIVAGTLSLLLGLALGWTLLRRRRTTG